MSNTKELQCTDEKESFHISVSNQRDDPLVDHFITGVNSCLGTNRCDPVSFGVHR